MNKVGDMNVVYAECTSIACPFQWEGKLEDGRMFYYRSRHGYLTIELSKEPIDSIDDMWPEDGKYDGYILEMEDAEWGAWSRDKFIENMKTAGFNMDKVLYNGIKT